MDRRRHRSPGPVPEGDGYRLSTACVDGRLVLTATHMSGDENKKPVREARMLSFAASP
ncbi:hypothetical protein [Streptomyces parvus]|uniref:hypothetical protein n=1 Tax=Streptomyces parvus TaxID=66428 RepID=UPI00363973D4